LTNTTVTLDNKIDQTRQELDEQHGKFYQEYILNKQENDERFSSHLKRIRANTDLLEVHVKTLEDIKVFRESTIKNNDKME